MNKLINGRTPLYRAVIAGSGSCLPDKVLTNEDLSKMVDTSDEWIKTRTGISQRRIAGDGETTASISAEAARRALADSGTKPEDIDLIILATITPEMVTPATACFVQREIGAVNAAAFDLSAACSGFLFALSVGQQYIESGCYKNILVIGAETLSRITNWEDRTSCILFGDGAGAVVLKQASDGENGIVYCCMGSDGNWEFLNCEAYGSKFPPYEDLEEPDKIYMYVNGREIYQQAVRRIVEMVKNCLKHCNLSVDDIAMVIPHQMNARIIESVAKRLKLGDDKIFVNINKYGNTSAASIPIALDECRSEGKIKAGDIIVLVAFGAGLTWSASIIQL